jgi:transposase
MRETYLSKFYWKLKQRRGAKKAIVALARKMMVIIYNILKTDTVYSEEKFEIAKAKQNAVQIKKLIANAKKLGLEIVSQ